MVYRVLGMIGRTLIASGVILLLFVGYQLWGTGIQTHRAQDRLESEFEDQLAALADSETSNPPTTTASPPSTDPADPGTNGEPEIAPVDGLPAYGAGDPVGRVTIPDIGSDWIFVEDVDLRYLKEGPGHFPGSRYPGQEGNAALAGHRTTYGAPFHRIDEVDPGDEIDLITPQGEFTYRVLSAGELAEDMPFDVGPDQADDGHFIIGPRDSWILDDYGDNRLTLMACHPKYSARERIVTVGELVGPAAPTPDEPADPQTSAIGALGGGDSSKRTPAILWGLATAAVWFTFWYLGRVWRRWPAYLIGTPLVLLVLFGCFTYVEQLLPAGY